jgi:ketosteroid isomerase-like protein
MNRVSESPTGDGECSMRRPITQQALGDIARGYLAALDRLDLKGTLSYFAPDAIFIIQTAHRMVEGRDAIREMWTSLFGAHETMEHRLASIVIDEQAGRVATEQSFRGVHKDGEVETRYSAYVFEVDEQRKVKRVIVWIDGETPAGG